MEINKNILKAYENPEFMNSREGRTLRILSEYFHPQAVLKKNRIYNTVVFFGSARSISSEDYEKKLTELEKKQKNGKDVSDELKKVKSIFTKSCALRESKKKGYKIKKKDITFKKPGFGFKEKDIYKIIGKTLIRDVSSNRILKKNDFK